MAFYIMNRNRQNSESGGNFEVHNTSTCEHLPNPENQLTLGFFDSCGPAKAAAKQLYPNVAADIDGCFHCCRPCHTR